MGWVMLLSWLDIFEMDDVYLVGMDEVEVV